jgi:diguanylate cyclase (GGDEF)-like protein
MVEEAVGKKFTKILDDLERMTNLGRRKEPGHRELTLNEITQYIRPELNGTVSVEYFRLVRLLLLQEVLGGAAGRQSYLAGEKFGRQLRVASQDELCAAVRTMGMAKATIQPAGTGEDKDRLTITFSESAVSTGLPLIGEPVCHFEAGLLAGALEKLSRKKVVVTETKCAAMGYDYCQFEATIGEGLRQRRRALEEMDYSEYSEENVHLLSTLAAHAVTALENALLYEQTRKLVITDPLTGVYNYGYFQTRLKEEIQRSERKGHTFSLVMVDLDNFKAVNDRFGHRAGDAILKDMARIMKENVRGIDIICRYGGDEFTLILPQTLQQETTLVVERVRREIERFNFGALVGGETELLHLSASFGSAVYPGDSRYSDQLIEQADQALYGAKSLGRNRLCFYNELSKG